MEALRVRKSSFKKDKLRSSVFDTDAGGATTKEGYLSKKSHGLMSKWQKRFFRLEGHYLKYFDNEKMARSSVEVKGVIDLNHVSAIDRNGAELVIKLKAGGPAQKFKADAEAAATEWSAALEETLALLTTESNGANSEGAATKPDASKQVKMVVDLDAAMDAAAAPEATGGEKEPESSEPASEKKAVVAKSRTPQPQPPPLNHRKSRRFKEAPVPPPPSHEKRIPPPPPSDREGREEIEVETAAASRWDFEEGN